MLLLFCFQINDVSNSKNNGNIIVIKNTRDNNTITIIIMRRIIIIIIIITIIIYMYVSHIYIHSRYTTDVLMVQSFLQPLISTVAIIILTGSNAMAQSRIEDCFLFGHAHIKKI